MKIELKYFKTLGIGRKILKFLEGFYIKLWVFFGRINFRFIFLAILLPTPYHAMIYKVQKIQLATKRNQKHKFYTKWKKYIYDTNVTILITVNKCNCLVFKKPNIMAEIQQFE